MKRDRESESNNAVGRGHAAFIPRTHQERQFAANRSTTADKAAETARTRKQQQGTPLTAAIRGSRTARTRKQQQHRRGRSSHVDLQARDHARVVDLVRSQLNTGTTTMLVRQSTRKPRADRSGSTLNTRRRRQRKRRPHSNNKIPLEHRLRGASQPTSAQLATASRQATTAALQTTTQKGCKDLEGAVFAAQEVVQETGQRALIAPARRTRRPSDMQLP